MYRSRGDRRTTGHHRPQKDNSAPTAGQLRHLKLRVLQSKALMAGLSPAGDKRTIIARLVTASCPGDDGAAAGGAIGSEDEDGAVTTVSTRTPSKQHHIEQEHEDEQPQPIRHTADAVCQRHQQAYSIQHAASADLLPSGRQGDKRQATESNMQLAQRERPSLVPCAVRSCQRTFVTVVRMLSRSPALPACLTPSRML